MTGTAAQLDPTGPTARKICAERGSPKYEKAAMRWLERYLNEGTPWLQHFAEVAAGLASRHPD